MIKFILNLIKKMTGSKDLPDDPTLKNDVTLNPDEMEESNTFFAELLKHDIEVGNISPAPETNLYLDVDLLFDNKKDFSIRNWISDRPVYAKTKLDDEVDAFLQMFVIGVCTYFDMDFTEIRDINDLKNRLSLYNDQAIVRKFEYVILNKLYCLAEASFEDYYESVCHCQPSRLTKEIQEALRTGSTKQLKHCLYAIESSEYGFGHMILRHLQKSGRESWMYN